MKNRTSIILVIAIAVIFAVAAVASPFENADVLRIGVPEELVSLPIMYAYEHGKLDFSDKTIELIPYATENHMIYDATTGYLDAFLCEAPTFIATREALDDFIVISATTKDLFLMGSPENSHISKLNDVKAAALGVYNYNQCDLLLDMTIQSQNIIGLTLDEALINDPIRRCELLLDSSLDFGIYPAPYADYLSQQGARNLQNMQDLEPAMQFLVFSESLETEQSEAVSNLVAEINHWDQDRTLSDSNKLLSKYLDLPRDYKLRKLPEASLFQRPDRDQLDMLLSWMYNTKRISSKYKYSDIVTEQATDIED